MSIGAWHGGDAKGRGAVVGCLSSDDSRLGTGRCVPKSALGVVRSRKT